MFARQLDTGFESVVRSLALDPAAGLAGWDLEGALVRIAESLRLLGTLNDRSLA